MERQSMEESRRSWRSIKRGRETYIMQGQEMTMHLRAGLRGLACETVRRIPHADLAPLMEGKPRIQGVELFLQTLETAVAREKPLRASDLFRCQHNKSGWPPQMKLRPGNSRSVCFVLLCGPFGLRYP